MEFVNSGKTNVVHGFQIISVLGTSMDSVSFDSCSFFIDDENLLLLTQYFDIIRDVGSSSELPHFYISENKTNKRFGGSM